MQANMNASRRSIYIHVGYHKTATSWLQQVVFPKHPHIEFWDPRNRKFEWLTQIAYLHDFDFPTTEFKSKIDQALESQDYKPVVISWEGFMGDPFTGAQTSKRNADRLHSLFPDARIIVGIRSQMGMLVSLYRQYVQEGGTCTLPQLLSLPASGRVKLDLNHLCFDRLLNYYVQLFGFESVYIYLYEDIKNKPVSFLHELLSYIGVEPLGIDRTKIRKNVNRSLSPFSVRIMRFANLFLANTFTPVTIVPKRFLPAIRLRYMLQGKLDPLLFSRFMKDFQYIPADLVLSLRAHYRSTNEHLVEQFNLPLQNYDYPL